MTKKVKILYFIQLPPPVHGVSTINDLIYNSQLINENIDKHLIEIKFSNNLSELRRLTFRKIIKVFSILRQLNRIIRQIKPDYVYFSIMPVGKGFWRDLLFVRAIRKHEVKIIYHLHNRGMENRSGNAIYRKLYQYVYKDSIIIHLSESLMRKEIGVLNLNSSLTKVIPNGIPVVATLARDNGDPVPRLLFVSNIFAEKGMSDLLQIMNILRDKVSDIQLHIVGDFMRNAYRRKLTKMIATYRLNEY